MAATWPVPTTKSEAVMAKNDFPKATPAGKYPLGNAKENKDASAYTGFKYPSGGGNDIGVAAIPPLWRPRGVIEAVAG